MAYRHIENLYRNKEILMFKQCFAMEKIHGTSAHVKYNREQDKLIFFSGGAKHEQFLKLFDQEELHAAFKANCEEHNVSSLTVWGEAYGGKMQGMSATYGKELKFIAFEVLIEDNFWQSVPQAEKIAKKLGFEFVHYDVIDTTEEAINAAMMADSVQAVRNGMGTGHMREGVVLRPLIELQHNNGGRIICKHKRPEFAEREHTPRIDDPEEMKVLEDAQAVADEWVVHMRLMHVLDKLGEVKIENANLVIKAMLEDVLREAEGEIVDNKAVRRAIGKKTMKLFKDWLAKGTFEKE